MNTTHITALLRTTRNDRRSRKRHHATLRRSILGAGIAALLCGASPVFAGSATWLLVPTDNNWNSANNWTAGGPPNGSLDTATFFQTTTPSLRSAILSANTEVNTINFLPTANAFTITAAPTFTLTISGTGITNSSGVTQNFVNTTTGSFVGRITFTNSATAGSLIAIANNGAAGATSAFATTTFNNTSSAGNATITNFGGTGSGAGGGFLIFNNTANASTATINNNGGAATSGYAGSTFFRNNSNAGSAVINNNAATAADSNGGGNTSFDTASAGSATITNYGGATFTGSFQAGSVSFGNNATAGTAIILNNASTVAGSSLGGNAYFASTSTAGGATITNAGAAASGLGAGSTGFLGGSAGTATINNEGGSGNGASGGQTSFGIPTTLGGSTFTNPTGANSIITNKAGTFSGALGGSTYFGNPGIAGSATITNKGATVAGAFGGTTTFVATTASSAVITNEGAAGSGLGAGGSTIFNNSGTFASTAENATITNNGGTASGAAGGTTTFNDTSTAGSGHFTTNGGAADTALGGITSFFNSSTAGSGIFTNNGGTVSSSTSLATQGGSTIFHDTSTAASATITNVAVTVLTANPGSTVFHEGSTAGSSHIINNGSVLTLSIGGVGGLTQFFSNATAGSATITNNAAIVANPVGGETDFFGTSNAGTSAITNKGGLVSAGDGGRTFFFHSATASMATFVSEGGTVSGALGARTAFVNTSTAGGGTFTNNAGTASAATGGTTEFYDTATAGSGKITNGGCTVSGAFGGFTGFNGSSTAANATITSEGGTLSGATGGLTVFHDTSNAGNATLIANPGMNGGAGGAIFFTNSSTGGTPAVKVFGNGFLDITGTAATGVTIGSLEGTGNAFLGANTLTVGSNHVSTTFSGVIQDGGLNGGTGGALTKIGAGTLILTGANTYTGNTNVNGGVLSVNGSIASPSTFVNPGGTLGGTGIVLGHLTNSGTVKPGDSPGTLTIGGNYTQLSNGTLQIAVAGAQAGQFSVLAVGGKASLAGTLQVVQESGATLKGGDRLKILTAVGGVSGVFSTTVNPFSLLGIQVIYETNDVLLAFTQNSFAAITGLTPNQTAVARTLDGILSDPRAAKVIAFLNGESLGIVPSDLDKLGPEELTSIFHLAKALANIQTANVLHRTGEIRSEAGNDGGIAANSAGPGGGPHGPVGKRSKAVAPAENERWGIWMAGSGEFTQVGNRSNAAGFSLDSAGVTAGVDYRFTDHFAAGISLGYMNTTASLSNGGKIDADGGRVGAYATYFDRGLYIDAAVSGGANGYSTRRTTPNNTTATASPQGTEVNLLLATGYDWKWKGLTIGPTASFQYTNVQLDGFTESGTFSPLTVATKNADSARSALGFHATFDKKVGRAIIRPEVRAAWQHEFGDTSYSLTSSFATLGGSAFTVAGPETGRDSLLVGAGLSVLFNDRFSIYAYYDGELLRANYSSHNISAGFRYRF
jgi:outer membrane autotransporter protein